MAIIAILQYQVTLIPAWSEPGANNTKAVGSVPLWALNLGAGLDDPSESLPIEKIL